MDRHSEQVSRFKGEPFPPFNQGQLLLRTFCEGPFKLLGGTPFKAVKVTMKQGDPATLIKLPRQKSWTG